MGEPEEPPIRFTDNRKINRAGAVQAAGGGDTPPAGSAAAGSDADAAHDEEATVLTDAPSADAQLLEERTRDLQRVSAEYANYRKRADRDRLAAGHVAVGRTLAELLPVVDDLDRAKAHGDLSGALKSVADKLEGTFAKLGLVPFGETGDPFDPAIHEAVLHDESDDVTVPTCTTIMRQGYRHGERLLRPAMVGVTDPLHPSSTSAPTEPNAGGEASGESSATTAHPAEDISAGNPTDESDS